jgi:hypothetical protein
MKELIEEFYGIYYPVTQNSIAAAILVLAQVIEDKEMLDEKSAENLGHELCLALKDVFPDQE